MKLFISYSSKDSNFAQWLKPRLDQILSEKSEPLEIFDAQSEISVGTDVRKTIKEAMNAANTVVIVSSPQADDSELVNYEAGLADALGKDVVIVSRKGTGKSAIYERLSHSAKFIEIDDNG